MPSEITNPFDEMNDIDTIEDLIYVFEQAVQLTEEGQEFWYARDLQKLFQYTEWRKFSENVIEKAKIACDQSGNQVLNHFVQADKMVTLGSGSERKVDDIILSRYACYLTAQNADSKKPPVAFAQTYFAIQTRKQELSDQANRVAVPMAEDEKRVYLRNQIKEHNKQLSSAAKAAGVITPKEFAIFHSKGYQGLYGKTVPEIRSHKGLSKSAEILDRMGSTELAANFFRVTQTEEKLRKDNIVGIQKAYDTHYAVGRKVRDAMLEISGTRPEDLPAVDSIKKAEKRLSSIQQPMFPLENVEQSSNVVKTDTSLIENRPVDIKTEIWKYALLVMATKENGEISTSNLIEELQDYIKVPVESQEMLSGRKDSKFSQLVRNLKSHKTTKSNFIYLGYAESIRGGFRITDKGHDFVKAEFS